MLLKLTAADHGRVLNDGTGLSGKVHAGAKGVSVHFRYRFGGQSREMALGAWPRVTLDAILANFEETRLRVERGGDPAGQKQAVAKKIQIEQGQLEQQQREQAEQQLTVQAMFEDWHVAAQVDNTPESAKAVRRMFELHLLPQAGTLRVLDAKPEHVRKVVKVLIDAGKVSTAISLYIYINAMFVWAGKRKPWRLLFEINPAGEVDLDRMLPAGYQSWCERALADDEIIELRNRFETIQNTWELHTGPRRGRIAKPIPREHVLGCWIMLATLVRINELCAARWKEHINFKAATWFIPSDQAKNRKSITIHLSRFALRLLRELYAITGHTPFVLPHPDNATVPCTTAVLQCAIVARQSGGRWKKKRLSAQVTTTSLMLSGGPWSCHDLRRTGSTLMQACGIDERIVDRCLNHSITTQARRQAINPRLLRTYQRYDYAKEMREAWDRLGEYLTNLDGALTQISGPDSIVVANDNTASLPQIEAA